MKSKIATGIGWVVALLASDSCLDPYYAASSKQVTTNLVVDGFLNGSDGTCTVMLSRTVPLDTVYLPPPETGATVRVEDESGTGFILNEMTAGTYTVANLPYTPGDKVRLRITTKQHVDYESEVITVLKTPVMDSLNWIPERAGVSIYVTSHNAPEENQFYYWTYTETWAYTARYGTSLTLNKDHQVIPLAENIFQCWKTAKSKDILVGTSSVRTDNSGIVNRFPLVIAEWAGPKLQSRYSILVEQRAISKETLEYLEQLKKNTENLGTLFDPLPSTPVGNVKCLTRSSEPVQGYFRASTVEQKRIFIDRWLELTFPQGVIPDTGYSGCILSDINGPSDWFRLWPVNWSGSVIKGTTKFCVDCRLNGGTNIEPDFWTW